MVKVKIRAKKDCPGKGYFLGEVIDASSMDCFYVFTDSNGELRTRLKEEFDIVEEQSPVRTVTRKEIVPGVYGAVHVTNLAGCGIVIGIPYKDWSPEELREAAHILNQIAEVLEDETTN